MSNDNIWLPHLTVAAIIEQKGRFLCVEELAHGETVINQPAGHVEKNETLVEACIRETLEETAWRVKPSAFLGTYMYTSYSNNITYCRMSFIAEALEEVPNLTLDNGILRAQWFSAKEIRNKKAQLRSPMVLKCIEDYLSGQSYPLDIICEQETIKRT